MWSLLINNYPCNEKDILRTSQIHFEKLLKAKSNINNKVPNIPFFMKNKIYLKQFLKANERKITIGNNIMYNKLFSAANCFSPYSKSKNIPKYCPAFDKRKYTYSRMERERTISSENQSFYKRFSRSKSNYPITYFLKKSKYEDYIRHNISRTRFLPKVTLKLCTFKEFKSNLMKETSKIKDNSQTLNETNISIISKPKDNIHNLNKTHQINSTNNNNILKKDLKKKAIYKYNNLKRCQSVKYRTFNKITYDY